MIEQDTLNYVNKVVDVAENASDSESKMFEDPMVASFLLKN